MQGDEVEKWIKGFNSILDHLRSIGPYREANQGVVKDSEEASEFRKMFEAEETNYLRKYFEPAKEISKRYILAAETFSKEKEITDRTRETFLTHVPDADLTSPLMAIYREQRMQKWPKNSTQKKPSPSKSSS